MATTTVLANPALEINNVDYTDQCTQVVVTERYESLESTSFGGTARKFTAGLAAHEVTVTLMLAYGTAEVEANLEALVGTQTSVEIWANGSTTPGATNPKYTLTDCYLESFTPINGQLGQLQTCDLTFTGGTLARVIA